MSRGALLLLLVAFAAGGAFGFVIGTGGDPDAEPSAPMPPLGPGPPRPKPADEPLPTDPDLARGIGPREWVRASRIGPSTAVIVTDRRARGLSPSVGGFFPFPMHLRERLESVDATANVATVMTTVGAIRISPVTVMVPGPQVSDMVSVPLMVLS